MTAVRDVARESMRAVRAVAARSPLPRFLIIGAQKAGTTSLFEYLTQSEGVRRSLTREVHFFDHNYDRGLDWYRNHFPIQLSQPGPVTGESSPYYLLHPAVPERVAETIPDVRLIVLLRNPVSRAYSHFQHSRRFHGEPLEDFEQALAAEGARTDEAWERLLVSGGREPAIEWYSYVRRSRYAPQLARWFEHFGRESFLIMTAEELYRDPAAALNRARRHARLPDTDATRVRFGNHNANSYAPLSPAVRDTLAPVFDDDIAEVEDMLGITTGWRRS